jgi:exopolysaccharide production protein ExoZ
MTKLRRTELVGIQVLRALAAMMVVFHHALEQSNGAANEFSPDWLTTFGAAGVDIFFVISGFIMMYTTFDTRPIPLSPGSFLFRRATRIYPLYWICFAAILVLSAAGFFAHHPRNPSDILRSFLLLPADHLVLGVSWTLVYEVYFYLLFSVSLVARSRTISAVATTGAIGAMILIGPLLPPGALKKFFSDPIPLEFCMGLWLAWLAGRRPVSLGWWWAAPALAAIVVAAILVPHESTNGLGHSRVIAWGLPSLLLVAAALPIARNGSKLLLTGERLGNASYALYLTHFFVMLAYSIVLKRTGLTHAPQFPFVILVTAAAIVLSILVHEWLERPIARLIARATRRSPGIEAEPTVGASRL